MTINIFSNFDPIWFNLCYKNSIIISIAPILIIRIFWYKQRKITILLLPVISYIILQLKRTKLINIKSLLLIISSLFIIIIYINIIGMLPYMFSITRHIIITTSLSIPTWIILIIRRTTFSIKITIGHLLPDRAPTWLNPFLIIIESIRISVRPVTLRFRLAANITAGHVVLSIMSSFSVTIKPYTFLIIMIRTNLYIIFELIICTIQAYIFCLLLSLYSNDHS